MKHLSIIIATTIILISSISHAQTYKKYGLLAGIEIANQDFQTDYYYFTGDRKYRKGLNLGAFIEVGSISKNVSIFTSINYTQKGHKFHDEQIITDEMGNELGNYVDDNRFDYLSFPIMAKIKLKKKTFSPYFLIGPRIDYKLNYKFTNEKPGEKVIGFIRWDLENYELLGEFKKITYGVTIGFGFENSTLLKKMMFLELRYNPDLTDADDSDKADVKNKTFELLFGISLN